MLESRALQETKGTRETKSVCRGGGCTPWDRNEIDVVRPLCREFLGTRVILDLKVLLENLDQLVPKGTKADKDLKAQRWGNTYSIASGHR